MLLFADGFEAYNVDLVEQKWGRPQGLLYGVAGFSKVVSGIEPSSGKAYASGKEGGRALYSGSAVASLGTSFRPSRTIFLGLNIRTRNYLTLTINFEAHGLIRRLRTGVPGTVISSLKMEISQWRIAITQTFTGTNPQVGDINTTMDMYSGDYNYIQVGMTLNGNESANPKAWMEVRVGNDPNLNFLRYYNILTSAPDNTGDYSYISGLSINTGEPTRPEYGWWGNAGEGTCIDDVYICNDEGDVNNTFLGKIWIRRLTPVADGIDLDSIPTLHNEDAKRFQAVDEDFMSTNVMPVQLPEDPLFISWEDGYDDYLTLMEEGDRQSVRFTGGTFASATPYIHGAVLHVLAKAEYLNLANTTMLKGYKRQGESQEISYASEVDIPLSECKGAWENYPLVFDNNEITTEGQPNQIWTAAGISSAEFGVELAKSTINPVLLTPGLNRFNLVFQHLLTETCGISDVVHRAFEDPIYETLGLTISGISYQYTWKFTETLYWDGEVTQKKILKHYLYEILTPTDYIPWTFLFAQDTFSLSDNIFLEWHDTIEDTFNAEIWEFGARVRADGTGDWDERTSDSLSIAETAPMISWLKMLDDAFGLEEPYMWDNHELIEETIEVNVTYLWDNHELMEEYLSLLETEPILVHFHGEVVMETFGFDEDHFDGWTVEQPEINMNFADSILTMQWRHEWFYGVCTRSEQIAPIEINTQEGSRLNQFSEARFLSLFGGY